MDGGAWWAAVHGVAKSRTWLSDFTFTFHFYELEKEMATHSSVLAWRIPEMGSHRVRHDWSDLAAAAWHIFLYHFTFISVFKLKLHFFWTTFNWGLVFFFKFTLIVSLFQLVYFLAIPFFFSFDFFFLICSEFCHTLKWNVLEFTCLPHLDTPSHLPLHPLPPGPPRAPGLSACLMHPTWAGDLFHPW